MKTCLGLIAIVSICWSLTAPDTQSRVTAGANGRVDEDTLKGIVPDPRIQAYDLSPQGDTIAAFVVSGDLIEAPSWVILVSTADSKILKQMRFGTSRQHVQGYYPQVAFAANGNLLVVEDGQTVSILDVATLTKVRTLTPDGNEPKVPAGILTAAKNMIAAISFGTGVPVVNYLDKQPTHIEIIDLSTGKQVAGWDEDDIPFSISPEAGYLAVSDHSTQGSVMGVAILDARSGKRVFSLSGGYKNQTASVEKPWSRLIAKFMSDDQVILTPDGNRDQSGREAGTSVKVVRFKDAYVTQEIDPAKYGPTGELAVSADQSTFVTVSRYVAARYLTHHWRIPPDSNPELLVFSKQQTFRLDSRRQLPPLLSLRARGKFEIADVRVSANGSVISVAEDYGVTILARR